MSGRAERVEASYADCHRVARQAGSNFYPCFLLLGRPRRRAMEALYAFLRHTDDLADDLDAATARRELADWRTALTAALDGSGERADSSKPPILPAVADTAARFKIPRGHLFAVLDGVEMDLDGRDYETFDELAEYCYRVAGVVGLACLRIWGFDGEEPVDEACACGQAFQMTNILRDLREDAGRGRLYLPKEDLRRFGYTLDDLAAGVADDRFARLVQLQAERTEALYRRAIPLAGRLATEGRRMFLMMIRVYYRIFMAIRERPADVLARRIRLGRTRKLEILLRSLLRPTPKTVLP